MINTLSKQTQAYLCSNFKLFDPYDPKRASPEHQQWKDLPGAAHTVLRIIIFSKDPDGTGEAEQCRGEMS